MNVRSGHSLRVMAGLDPPGSDLVRIHLRSGSARGQPMPATNDAERLLDLLMIPATHIHGGIHPAYRRGCRVFARAPRGSISSIGEVVGTVQAAWELRAGL